MRVIERNVLREIDREIIIRKKRGRERGEKK